MAEPKHSDQTTIERPGAPLPESGWTLDSEVSLIFSFGTESRLIKLGAGESITVGRASAANVAFDDSSLSRVHARFSWDGRALTVEDLGSRNGVFIQGVRVGREVLGFDQNVSLGEVTAATHGQQRKPVGDIESLDRLLERVEREVARSRLFRRPLALLMMRTAGVQPRPSHAWCAEVRQKLREIDGLALYGAHSAIALLPEYTAEQAMRAASALEEIALPVGLLIGVATFPESGSTGETLLDAARTAGLQATTDSRVALAAVSTGPRDDADGAPVITNPRMLETYRMAARAAATDVPVLITGETGTGKELVARFIHEQSPRSTGALVPINCGAIPPELALSVLFGHVKGAFTGADKSTEGAFERASGGTLFLDEVAELPETAQAALLRVLETQHVSRVGSTREIAVDVRLVAATHRDLEAMAEQKVFRLDLLYRLNAVALDIPPLRERTDEIQRIAEQVLHRAARAWERGSMSFHPGTIELLRAYSWPGNVRELRNVVQHAVVFSPGPSVLPEHLPEKVGKHDARKHSDPPERSAPIVDDMDLRTSLERYQASLIVDALKRVGGNQRKAATLLGMPLRTLVRRIKELGVKKDWKPE